MSDRTSISKRGEHLGAPQFLKVLRRVAASSGDADYLAPVGTEWPEGGLSETDRQWLFADGLGTTSEQNLIPGFLPWLPLITADAEDLWPGSVASGFSYAGRGNPYGPTDTRISLLEDGPSVMIESYVDWLSAKDIRIVAFSIGCPTICIGLAERFDELSPQSMHIVFVQPAIRFTDELLANLPSILPMLGMSEVPQLVVELASGAVEQRFHQSLVRLQAMCDTIRLACWPPDRFLDVSADCTDRLRPICGDVWRLPGPTPELNAFLDHARVRYNVDSTTLDQLM
jgi:hypothetical protein